MKAKKFIALFAAAFMLFALAACGGESASSESASTEPVEASESASEDQSAQPAAAVTTVESGKLTVGIEIPYPPFEMFAEDGVTPIGLDVDFATALAEQLGLEVQFENVAWDGIFAGLAVDKYDVVISACTITPERLESVDFSDSYFENYQTISVMPDSDKEISEVKDLEGLTVGFQTGTSADEYLNKLIDAGELTCETRGFDKMPEAFSDLKAGRIDAVICDEPVAVSYAKNDEYKVEIKWTQPSDPEYFAVAVKKDNAEMLDAINGAIKAIQDNGVLDKIKADWTEY